MHLLFSWYVSPSSEGRVAQHWKAGGNYRRELSCCAVPLGTVPSAVARQFLAGEYPLIGAGPHGGHDVVRWAGAGDQQCADGGAAAIYVPGGGPFPTALPDIGAPVA